MSMTGTPTSEDEAAERADLEKRNAAIEANMVAAGVKTTELVQEDYFAFDVHHKFVLPDGVSFVMHKALTEGDRKKYLKSTNRDIRIKKTSGDAEMRMATGEEKYALLEQAIVGWNFLKGGQPIQFSKQALTLFLDNTNPVIIDMIHKDVMKHNPWLLQEMTVEDIDKEIEALKEMREIAEKREEGKAGS